MRNWDLFKEMDQLHREINGLFNGHHRGRLFGPAFEPGLGLRQYPKINLRDDADNVYVEALLPGVEPDSIDMNVLGNTLTLRGGWRVSGTMLLESFRYPAELYGNYWIDTGSDTVAYQGTRRITNYDVMFDVASPRFSTK